MRVKQAYYQSTAPLVPFLIIIVFGLLQLLPFSLGAVIRSAIVSSFVLSGWLSFVTGLIVVALGVWGIYMLVPTIFALYIVTLPGVMPRDAMRSAKDLVRFRRLLLLRKILFLPFFIMVCMAVITVPLILYATSLVAAVFYVLGVLGLLFAHGYLYSLYRDLIE